MHSRDLRAKLEVSIEKVVSLVKAQENMPTLESDYASDSEDVSGFFALVYYYIVNGVAII